MKQQVLFVVEIPSLPRNTVGMFVAPDWTIILDEVGNTINTFEAPIQLQSNAWLIPVDNSLPGLLALCELALKCHLSYSAVLIPEGATIMANNAIPKP